MKFWKHCDMEPFQRQAAGKGCDCESVFALAAIDREQFVAGFVDGSVGILKHRDGKVVTGTARK
jgi:hypothetical protein